MCFCRVPRLKTTQRQQCNSGFRDHISNVRSDLHRRSLQTSTMFDHPHGLRCNGLTFSNLLLLGATPSLRLDPRASKDYWGNRWSSGSVGLIVPRSTVWIGLFPDNCAETPSFADQGSKARSFLHFSTSSTSGAEFLRPASVQRTRGVLRFPSYLAVRRCVLTWLRFG